MRIQVNNCRLYVDVVGSGLTAEGPKMVERPIVFVLHGGPGADHSTMKPDFNPLAEVAQLVYYDHRGQGRSDPDKSDNWHLDQWADDLRGLIDTLGIETPIVLGLSFGGFVAQNYAVRHPDRLHKLILASTVARMVPQRVFEASGMVPVRRIPLSICESVYLYIPVLNVTVTQNKDLYGHKPSSNTFQSLAARTGLSTIGKNLRPSHVLLS